MFKNLDNCDRQAVEMIKRMAIIAEYRDEGIREHLERIRGFTFILAINRGMSTAEAEIIANAAMLHDIGKVGLPEELQFTPARLSPADQEVLKKHVNYGVELLHGTSSRFLQAAEIIVTTHHERWDGSGYPQGLGGETIPLSGRIVAVADVFDALTTKRAYKPNIPVESALKLVRDSSGTLFDPGVVKAFSDHFDDILRIHQAYHSD